jgi:hypothetical protein
MNDLKAGKKEKEKKKKKRVSARSRETRNGRTEWTLTSPAAIRFMTSSCNRRICFGSGPAMDCMLSMLYMYARARVKPRRRDATRTRCGHSDELQFSTVLYVTA